MRKQYHFRESERGLLAWDIDRLVESATGFEVKRIPLSEIRELDEEYWFTSGENRPTCRLIAEHMRLVQEADLHFPIILDSRGRIFDGMHRVVKAFLERRETIEAVRFTQDPEPDHVGRRPGELPY